MGINMLERTLHTMVGEGKLYDTKTTKIRHCNSKGTKKADATRLLYASNCKNILIIIKICSKLVGQYIGTLFGKSHPLLLVSYVLETYFLSLDFDNPM